MNLSKIFLSRITSFFTTCVLLGSLCYAQDPTGDSFMDLEHSINELRSLISKNGRGTVSVSIYDDTGALKGSGSGFFIDNEGRIITNASIWQDAYSAEVKSDSGSYSEILIINRIEELDVTLIKVKATNEKPLELDFDYETKLGERVIIMGKSPNLVNTVSEGLISSLSKPEESAKLMEIQTTLPLLPNQISKDGPVLNTSGNVIGIAGNACAERKMSDETWKGFGDNRLYAISINSIRSLLSGSGNIEYLHPAKSKIWYKWLVSSLKTMALNGLLYLYNIGFRKVIAFLFVSLLIFYIIEHFYVKYI